jgi:adenylosuccinate lyase
MSREQSYDLTQKIAMQSWDNKESFWALLLENKEVTKKLTEKEILECFNIDYYLKNVDSIFKRVLKK